MYPLFAELTTEKSSIVLGVGLALLAFSAPATAAIIGRNKRTATVGDQNGSGPVKFREFSDFRTECKTAFAEIRTEIRHLIDAVKGT